MSGSFPFEISPSLDFEIEISPSLDFWLATLSTVGGFDLLARSGVSVESGGEASMVSTSGIFSFRKCCEGGLRFGALTLPAVG